MRELQSRALSFVLAACCCFFHLHVRDEKVRSISGPIALTCNFCLSTSMFRENDLNVSFSNKASLTSRSHLFGVFRRTIHVVHRPWHQMHSELVQLCFVDSSRQLLQIQVLLNKISRSFIVQRQCTSFAVAAVGVIRVKYFESKSLYRICVCTMYSTVDLVTF